MRFRLTVEVDGTRGAQLSTYPLVNSRFLVLIIFLESFGSLSTYADSLRPFLVSSAVVDGSHGPDVERSNINNK
jgi:hypothetical protein